MQAQLAGGKLIMVFLDSAGQVLAHRRRRAGSPLDHRGRAGARRRTTPRARAAAERIGATVRVGFSRGDRATPRSARRWPSTRSSQASSRRSAGAEIDRPATSLPWSSKMPAAMQRTPSSSSSSSRAMPSGSHAGQFALQRRQLGDAVARVAGQAGARGIGAHARAGRRGPGTACRPTSGAAARGRRRHAPPACPSVRCRCARCRRSRRPGASTG